MKTTLLISFITLLGACATFLILYFPRLLAWFGSLKKQKRLVATSKRKIAIIIPARNESKVITNLLDSIASQTYDKDCYHAFIMVKDKKDPTIQIAKKYGATCYVVADQTKKSDALDYALKKILKDKPNEFDGYYIVDADCLLDSKCLEELNNAMESDSDIIQSKKMVKNYLSDDKKNKTLAVTCNGIIWTLIDDMGNRFKTDHHITNMTIGTGIMLSNRLVTMMGGWPYDKTLTEDCELMYDCVFRGFTTFYYSYSRMYVEEATTLKVTNIRRNRWMDGLINSKKVYDDRIHSIFKGPKNILNLYYTTACCIAYAFFGFLSLAGIYGIVMTIINACLGNGLWLGFLLFTISSFGAIYLSFFLMTVMAFVVDGKYMTVSLGKKIATLFIHPFFYMGYIFIVAKVYFNVKRQTKWISIERINFSSKQ